MVASAPGSKAAAPVRVLALSRYAGLGASSRVRMHQYVPGLDAGGFDIEVQPLLSDDYVRRLYSGQRIDPIDVARCYWTRIAHMRRSRRYDTIWTEKEMLPWLPAWFERALCPGGPRVVIDYDDATHVPYERHRWAPVRAMLRGKIGSLMQRADVITAGNRFLADHARSQGARRVVQLPSVVDLHRYEVVPAPERAGVCIGWIGSPATEHYLDLVGECLKALARQSALTLVTVGAAKFSPDGVQVQRRRWTLETEVGEIQAMDIGIMPLSDGPWERGKCGYKLLQYMACARPVVASAVGANREIITHGEDGLLAGSAQEWIDCLARLIGDRSLRVRMGAAARRKMEQHYSMQGRLDQLMSILRTPT